MSKFKSRGHRSSEPEALESKSNTAPAPTDVPPNDSFKDLRSKIQAQFQTLGQKGGKDKSIDARPKAQRKKQGKSKDTTATAERGKKRDRNGEVLKQATEGSKPSPKPNSRHAAPAGVDEEFFKEVQALGGTTEDLDLLADVDSDSEVEGLPSEQMGTAKPNRDSAALEKGMGNILKEIALAQGELEDDQATKDESEDEVVNRATTTKDGQKEKSVSEAIHQPVKKGHGQQPSYVCEPKPDWFEIEQPVVNSEKAPKSSLSRTILTELHEHAKYLLDEENRKFKSAQQSSSQSFYNTVITSGTLSDKISALTLAVQESPIHNVRALENLIGLAKKRSRSQAVDVLRSLKDLFAQGSLLPQSRKLQAFASQPALSPLFDRSKTWKRGDKLPRGLKEQHLVVWAYESWLKEQYFEVLKVLEVWCNDEIEFSKSKAISFVFELLKEKPEQESNLLRLLVNKLGDPVKKIASQASYLLMQLLITHPAMKAVVVSAIETDFIFRPGQSLHGKYYAVVTLNQTALSGKEEEVSNKLLDIYFGLFTGLLKPTIASATETAEKAEPEAEIEPRLRRRNKKPKVPVQPQQEELREKLISAILTGVNRAYPYAESKDKSFSDHLETLFKVTHSSNFNTSIQAMLLIQQLSTTHRASNDRFYRVLYESLLDPRLLVASKQQLYLNLLHRALKADLNIKRVKAFVKRLFQVLSLHDASFIVGAFFLLQDLDATFPSLSGLVDQPEDHDDDEEVFRDVDEEGTEAQASNDLKAQATFYDGHKRAPEYANADNSCAWELLPFLAHFHPSVSLSADHALRHAKLPGKPDLSLHTLSHFLDRFVYRNAKLGISGLRGSSIMQPMAAVDSQNVLIPGTLAAQRSLPVNSEAFRAKKDGEIAAEDVFFHKYFSSLGAAPTKKGKEKKKRDADDDESENEDEIWKAMMESAPELEGDDDSEDDLDLSELESAMDDSDAEAEDGDGFDDDDDEGVDIDPALFDESEDDLMDIGDGDTAVASASGESDFAGFDSAEDQAPTARKKKASKSESKKEKAKRKSLPIFASVEDYAKMLEDDEDEDK
ncbi:uncharacterized protein A1O9_09888 [Exophiala aquamarina CBS 119918]|uniref:CCAAT-binding factor domain-containing protein n=1 Tax=Exophiala aquamarina CBS 119918 TaxID=1182545 RepID=A0A072P497_9EURO|nr:uncharacterized protein A1O9_09888 [Exophiala aquamarina CBS 119918]KEF54093.1 hypothetical protein A1O9_09888 [Exophiala aquamarina CBS 119918]